MNEIELAIKVEDVVGLLESIRIMEGATLALPENIQNRCADEVEWCTSLLIGLFEQRGK